MPSTRPETRYAKSGDLNIAYQVVGDGPRDLIYVPGWISNVELNWEEPALAHVLERLASFSRLILFDKRGTGLSDPVPQDRLVRQVRRVPKVRRDCAASRAPRVKPARQAPRDRQPRSSRSTSPGSASRRRPRRRTC